VVLQELLDDNEVGEPRGNFIDILELANFVVEAFTAGYKDLKV
jgi:hypothetical protein